MRKIVSFASTPNEAIKWSELGKYKRLSKEELYIYDFENIEEVHFIGSKKGENDYEIEETKWGIYINMEEAILLYICSWQTKEFKLLEKINKNIKCLDIRFTSINELDISEFDKINKLVLSNNRYLGLVNGIEKISGLRELYLNNSSIEKNPDLNNFPKHQESVDKKLLSETKNMLQTYFLTKAINNDDRKQKERLRNSIIEIVRKGNNKEFEAEIRRLLYRPKNEMYIPIPKARKFHDMHPDFFGAGIGTFKENSKKLKLPKDQRKFNLIFEPSGDVLPAFIAQDDGKAIESVDKQTFLGEWILKGIFQLKDYEPLTEKRLEELGINGMRLYKTNTSEDIHLEFIWIDDENPPVDLI